MIRGSEEEAFDSSAFSDRILTSLAHFSDPGKEEFHRGFHVLGLAKELPVMELMGDMASNCVVLIL